MAQYSSQLQAGLCLQCNDIFSHEDRVLLDFEEEAGLRRKDRSRSLEDYKRTGIRTHHTEVADMAEMADAGCYICSIAWRHFFPEKTPQAFKEAPFFVRTDRQGRSMVHAFYRSGTYYMLSKPEGRGFLNYSDDAVELRIGINSPINQDTHIPEYKTLILSPLEGEFRTSCSAKATALTAFR